MINILKLCSASFSWRFLFIICLNAIDVSSSDDAVTSANFSSGADMTDVEGSLDTTDERDQITTENGTLLIVLSVLYYGAIGVVFLIGIFCCCGSIFCCFRRFYVDSGIIMDEEVDSAEITKHEILKAFENRTKVVESDLVPISFHCINKNNSIDLNFDQSQEKTYFALKISDIESSRNISSHTCSICLDDFIVGEKVVWSRECTHIFHDQCMLDWSMRLAKLGSRGGIYKVLCPTCRQDFVCVKRDTS